MTLHKLENESVLDYKYRLLVGKAKEEVEASWKDIHDTLNLGLSSDTIRKGSIFLPEFDEYLRNKLNSNSEELPQYKEVNEYKADGSHVSDKLIKLSEQELKNPDKLLEAHGFDKSQWTLTGARNSLWNSSVDKTLHSSRITVKPKVDGFDIEKVIEKINLKLHTRKVLPLIEKGERMLEIPLFDLHFGIGDLEYYQETLAEIVETIQYRKWDTIFIPIGQDALHTEGFNGTTTSGTIIGEVDFEKALDELNEFYTVIIDNAVENSNNVNVMFSAGNHDQLAGYMFVRMLQKQYKDSPTVKFDTEMKTRKSFVWNDIFIGVTHGDKGGNRIKENFMSEFGRQIAKAKVIEVHSGHIHHEVTKDSYGLVVRSLPTKAKTDKYHEVNGFIGSRKTFQLFEYNESKLKKIHQV